MDLKRLWRLLLVIGTLASFGTSLVNSPQSRSQHSEQLFVAIQRLQFRFGGDVLSAPPSSRFGIAWSSQKYEISKEFSTLAKAVEKEVRSAPSKVDAIIEKYSSRALEDPNDSKKLLSWAYAYLVAIDELGKEGRHYGRDQGGFRVRRFLEWTLAEIIRAPKDREIVRIRFLLEAGATERNDLTALGRRLLKEDTSDAMTERTLFFQLNLSKRLVDLKEAESIAERFLARSAKDPRNVAMMANVFLSKWLRLGMKSPDGREYLHWARKYLQLVPSDSDGAKMARYSIKQVEKDLQGKLNR